MAPAAGAVSRALDAAARQSDAARDAADQLALVHAHITAVQARFLHDMCHRMRPAAAYRRTFWKVPMQGLMKCDVRLVDWSNQTGLGETRDSGCCANAVCKQTNKNRRRRRYTTWPRRRRCWSRAATAACRRRSRSCGRRRRRRPPPVPPRCVSWTRCCARACCRRAPTTCQRWSVRAVNALQAASELQRASMQSRTKLSVKTACPGALCVALQLSL